LSKNKKRGPKDRLRKTSLARASPDNQEKAVTTQISQMKDILPKLVSILKEKYRLNSEDIIELLLNKELIEQSEAKIPVSVFKNNNLSPLETITKYLKEELMLSNHEIAILLNRSDSSIWITYRNASKKLSSSLDIKDSVFNIPVSVLRKRKLSVLESVVKYLKEKHNMRYRDIGNLLKRDNRTIWTVYHRASKKLRKGKIR